jgi:hypothetical protein
MASWSRFIDVADIIKFKVHIVSWEKETKVINYSCSIKINCQDLLDELSGLSNGYAFKSIHFWKIDGQEWSNVHPSMSLQDMNFDSTTNYFRNEVIQLYSESDTGFKHCRSYEPIWMKGIVDQPRRESLRLYQLCEDPDDQEVSYSIFNCLTGATINREIWPGFTIQHVFDEWFNSDRYKWYNGEICRDASTRDASHNGNNCFLGARIMVKHSTYTTYEKILFNTKSLRQLRLCDLECIGGKDRDRMMYLDFCPTELPSDESSPLKLKLALQPPLKRSRSIPYIPPPTPPYRLTPDTSEFLK